MVNTDEVDGCFIVVEFDLDALHSLRFIAYMSNPKSIAVARNATR